VNSVPNETQLNHRDFKKAISKRDSACLFCWRKSAKETHIIASKYIPVANDGPSILERTGLTQTHQVQNGLFLCLNCRAGFKILYQYVYVVDDKLVFNFVNETDDETSDKYREWEQTVECSKRLRTCFEKNWITNDARKGVELNGEMALYFKENDQTILPNRKALGLHKVACQIWRMAG
jgi:hypothetical protein